VKVVFVKAVFSEIQTYNWNVGGVYIKTCAKVEINEEE
jgi:hypothetical protein